MKKRTRLKTKNIPRPSERFATVFVLLAGLSLWSWSYLFHGDTGFLAWGRGAFLLAAALGVLRLLGIRDLPSLLFPVVWIAVSLDLRLIVGIANLGGLAWILLGWVSLSACVSVRDPKRLLQLVALPLAAMSLLMHSSILMLLAFLFFARRDRARPWMGPAVLSLMAVLIMVTQAWKDPGFLAGGWLDVYDFVASKGYLSFILLALLGMSGHWKRPFVGRGFGQFFLAWMGWVFWSPMIASGTSSAALGITFILLGGVGLRILKEEVLDDSWHGRLVWAMLGILLLIMLGAGIKTPLHT